jgi:hypothetical protein
MRCELRLVAAMVTMAFAPAATAATSPPSPPKGVHQLWSQFPLTTPRSKAPRLPPVSPPGHTRKNPVPSPKPRVIHEQRPVREQSHGSRFDGGTGVVIGSAAALIIALLLALSLRRPTSDNKGGRGMPDFLKPRGRKDDAAEESGETDWVTTAPGIYEPRTEAARAAAEPAAEAPAPASDSSAATATATTTLAGVGEHVAAVLASAEEAAQKIRAEAEVAARDARDQATREADEIRARAAQEAQADRESAHRLMEETESNARKIRSDADRYAEERDREANAQAAEIVRDAERRAASISDASNERHRVLLANIAASESRLRDLALSLRTVAGSLDDVLGEADAPKPGDEAMGREREAELLDETLRSEVSEPEADVAARP